MTTRNEPPTSDNEEPVAVGSDFVGQPEGTTDSWLGLAEAPIEVVEAEQVEHETDDKTRDPSVALDDPEGGDGVDRAAPADEAVEAEVVSGTDEPYEPPTMGWPMVKYQVVSGIGEVLERPDWGRGIEISSKERTQREWRGLRQDAVVKSNRLGGEKGKIIVVVHNKGGVAKSPTAGNLGNILSDFMPDLSIAGIDLNPGQSGAGQASGVYDHARDIPRWVEMDPHNDLEGFGVETANVLDIFREIEAGLGLFPEWAVNKEEKYRVDGKTIASALKGADEKPIEELVEMLAAVRGRQLIDPQRLLSMMRPSHWGLRTAVSHKPLNNRERITATMVEHVLGELVKHFELIVVDTGTGVDSIEHAAITGRADLLLYPVWLEAQNALDDLIETHELLRWRLKEERFDPGKVDTGIIAITGTTDASPPLEYYRKAFFPYFKGEIVGVPWSNIIRRTRMSRPDLLREEEPAVWHAYVEMFGAFLNTLPVREGEFQELTDQAV